MAWLLSHLQFKSLGKGAYSRRVKHFRDEKPDSSLAQYVHEFSVASNPISADSSTNPEALGAFARAPP